MRLTLFGPLPPLRGGIAHFSAALHEQLSKDHLVQTVSFRRLYPAWLYPGSSDKAPGAEYSVVIADVLLDTLNPWTWVEAAWAIRSHRPKAVILQWWTTFLAPLLYVLAGLLKWFGVKAIFIIHNVLPHEPRALDRVLTKMVLRKGHSFIVLNNLEGNNLKQIVSNANRVAVCSHPELEIFHPGSLTQEMARSVLDLPMQRKILLFFGFVRPYKGLEVLLESLALLRKVSDDWFLVVAGEIWGDRDVYLEALKRNGIEDVVRFEDRYILDEKVGVYLRAADIYVAPHLRGTQSGVLRTALNLGLACVATAHIAEGISRPVPERLVVVPSGDAEALKLGILNAANLPASMPLELGGGSGDLQRLQTTLLKLAES